MKVPQNRGLLRDDSVGGGRKSAQGTLGLGGFPFSLDLRPLHGQPFDVEQIGGYANWYRMMNEALRVLK
jgi:hypothetical protein